MIGFTPIYQILLTQRISLLPNKHKIVGCVVSSVSPFGKQESFFQKAIQTLNIFGLKLKIS